MNERKRKRRARRSGGELGANGGGKEEGVGRGKE